MSSSLKERLRRLSRVHNSPISHLNNVSEKVKKLPDAKHCMTSSPSKELYEQCTSKSSECEMLKSVEVSSKRNESCDIMEKHCIDTHQKNECDSEQYKNCDKVTLMKYLKDMKISLSKKEEKLRKLQRVKIYRLKNDLNKLSILIEKWREVSQESLKDFHNRMPEPRPSLTHLLDAFQIDHKLIKYDAEDCDFF